MIVDRFKLIKGSVILLAALLVVSVLLGYALVSSISKVFAFPVFLHLYFKKSDIKSKSFIGFYFYMESDPRLIETARYCLKI